MSDKQTPLFDEHVAAGARMAPFAGWAMPLHYGSQIAEHHAVRRDAGMFDVSHMTVIDFSGADALRLLRLTMANDPAKAVPGKAVYGVLLNADAGIIDDLIVYGLETGYRAVVNASTRDKVLDWLRGHARGLDVVIRERADTAMVAVQGPAARARFAAATGMATDGLASFSFLERGAWMVARTGYTGEDGVEVVLPAAEAAALWRRLKAAGVAPGGPRGARHFAPRSRSKPVWPGHGRTGDAARVQPRLDGCLDARGARFHRSRRAGPATRGEAGSRSQGCSPGRQGRDAPRLWRDDQPR